MKFMSGMRIIWMIPALFLAFALFGQQSQEAYLEKEVDPAALDEAKFKELTKGLNYAEKPPKEREEVEYENFDPDWDPSQLWGPIYKGLIVLLILILLGFIIYYSVNGDVLRGARNKKLQALNIAVSQLEENLDKAEIKPILAQAIEAGDYNLAIRLHYLSIIQGLSNRKFIRWKKDKTNYDYIREMRQHPLEASFREITAVFERVWYGSAVLTRADFQQLEPGFVKLEREIAQPVQPAGA